MRQLSNGVIFSFRMWEKCENLCKESQKMAKEFPFEFGTSSTPGKVGVGNLSVLFLSIPRRDKCDNLM